MQQLAAAFGTFLGYAIGYALKIAGPEIRVFLLEIVRDAMSKTYTIAKPDSGFNADPDLSGVLGDGKPRDSSATGNSGKDGKGA